jgi:pimeloyl-ACP methyl ester carboxylesterase
MIIPPGFGQKSIATSLGRMVYYTAEADLANPATDEPTLIFLHGFGGGSSAYEWSKVYPAFSNEYRILAPDLIGWGRSEHPVRNYRPEDYISTITEFIEQTCSTPATVVASSLTAAFMIRAAIARPQLFKQLILTTPSGLSDFGSDYTRKFFVQLIRLPLVDRLLYSLGIANRDGIRKFLEERQFARAERIFPEIIDAYFESATQPNAEYAALSFVRGDLTFDLALYLPQLTIPTTILWGEKSQFTEPAIGRRLAALNPSAIQSFQLLDDVGLTPQLEVPALTIGLIRNVLKDAG